MPISTEEFLRRVEEIKNEKPTYRKNGSATDGTCDCIGLIIGAIRRAGGSWPGKHGSNYAARNEMETLKPITGTSDLQIGDIVYKAHEPGEKGYDADTINKSYKNHLDQRDYYHVGVVTSVYPLEITHCTTPTVKTDTKLGAWNWYGQMKRITAGGEEQIMKEAKVVAPAGTSTVNLRQTRSTSSKLIDRMNSGDEITIITDFGDWCLVRWKGKTGYVVSNYIEYTEAPEDTDTDEPIDDSLEDNEREMIADAVAEIKKQVSMIETMLAKG